MQLLIILFRMINWIQLEIKKKKIRRENRKYRNRFTKKIEIEEKNDVLFE